MQDAMDKLNNLVLTMIQEGHLVEQERDVLRAENATLRQTQSDLRYQLQIANQFPFLAIAFGCISGFLVGVLGLLLLHIL